MNKKLFSWKALAGLALLVAMGLTSCKQDTVVDPTDPYSTKKPVKPGTTTGGDADLAFTITNATQVDSLWNKAVSTDTKKALAELEEINVEINVSNYKLDGKTMILPNFFYTTAAKGNVLNVKFTGAFAEAKKALILDLDKNLAGAEVNVSLPESVFAMDLTASKVIATLESNGATELTKLTATANSGKDALTIEDGVVVDGIIMTSGDITVASAANVVAKLVGAAGEALEEGKAGARIGTLDAFVKNLIITADASVTGAAKVGLDKITINEGVTVSLDKKSKVKEIVGLGSDLSKAAKRSTVNLGGDKDDFTTIESLENVYINGATATNVSDFDIFEDVIFNVPVNLLSEGAANTEFNKAVNIVIDNEDVTKIAFDGVNFGKNASVNISSDIEATVKNKVIKLFESDASTGKYVEVTSGDEDDLSAVNAKKEGASYTTKVYKTWKAITAAGITFDNKIFHFADIETAENTLKTAKKAYDDKVKSDGYKAANADLSVVNAYALAWEDLNGRIKSTKMTDDDGNNIAISFTAYTDTEIEALQDAETITTTAQLNAYNGLYRTYKNQWAFVTGANAAIKDSAWFTIYYGSTVSVEPEVVTIVFDDCTINNKAIDVDKMNELLGAPISFYSVEDAWYKIVLDGEALKWKKASGGYILK